MDNKCNTLMRDFPVDCAHHEVRIVMGDVNMACYAVEEGFAHPRLSDNMLAFHAKYVNEAERKTEQCGTKACPTGSQQRGRSGCCTRGAVSMHPDAA